MLKKILIIIIAVGLIVAGIFLFTYKPQKGSLEGDNVVVNDFFPSGDGTSSNQNTGGSGTSNSNGENPTNSFNSSRPRLNQISKNPVSGFTVSSTKTQDFVRFVDKGTGHIFETPTDSVSPTRISNTTIPKIQESVWVENGSGVILRYLKDDGQTIESFYAKLKNATSTNSDDGAVSQDLEGTFLPQNILNLVVSPQQTKVFYTTNTDLGSIGTESNPDGTKRNELHSSPLKEWSIAWPTTNTISFSTKPSFVEKGFLYFLNKSNLKFDKILSASALTTLVSPDANTVLYSEGLGGFTSTSLFIVKTKESVPFGVQTLPEKCVWSKTELNIIYCAVPKSGLFGNLPDDWYQGKISFSDELWKVDIENNSNTLVSDLVNQARQEMDITNLDLTPTEDYLHFVNKKDGSLWGLRINTSVEN